MGCAPCAFNKLILSIKKNIYIGVSSESGFFHVDGGVREILMLDNLRKKNIIVTEWYEIWFFSCLVLRR